MADYRQIHTKIWKDGWFLDLCTEDKLLFIYLFSNERANLAGLYDLPIKVIVFETGIPLEQVETCLERFEEAGKVHCSLSDWIWIPSLIRYNARNIESPKIQAHLQSLLSEIPDCELKRAWIEYYNGIVSNRYRIDTLSIPNLHEHEQEHEQEQEVEQENEQEEKTPSAATAPPSEPKSRRKSSKAKTPEAVKVFRENAHRYPVKAWYDDIVEAVGEEPADLELWGQIVKAYVGLGWNPGNVKNMLAYYEKREIPATKGQQGKGGARNASDEWLARRQEAGMGSTS